MHSAAKGEQSLKTKKARRKKGQGGLELLSVNKLSDGSIVREYRVKDKSPEALSCITNPISTCLRNQCVASQLNSGLKDESVRVEDLKMEGLKTTGS